ncbi:hypothetical protein PFISCL1PPCAC_1384 [Pristionchus fissidentatus]|uniref:Plasma membrane proteolipid 3 n=1 Tax=Pristionchus fissidentatus TaxID=1538716 RepID=A0AAV5USG7_9BILA|nr:hypothetical protein PFISCL1PPCAC_1384 [Pristionchus fissidentatus]
MDLGDFLCRCILCFIALICPPIAVMCHMGCDNTTIINLLLTLLFFIPGVIHAIFVICAYDPIDRRHGRVVVYTTNVHTRY